jgi:hypothetical protein
MVNVRFRHEFLEGLHFFSKLLLLVPSEDVTYLELFLKRSAIVLFRFVPWDYAYGRARGLVGTGHARVYKYVLAGGQGRVRGVSLNHACRSQVVVVMPRNVEVLLLHLPVQLLISLVLPQQTLKRLYRTLRSPNALDPWLVLRGRVWSTRVLLVLYGDFVWACRSLHETLLVYHKYIADFLVRKSKIFDVFLEADHLWTGHLLLYVLVLPPLFSF